MLLRLSKGARYIQNGPSYYNSHTSNNLRGLEERAFNLKIARRSYYNITLPKPQNGSK